MFISGITCGGKAANGMQIKFASGHDIPFLAKSGGHGAISSLGEMHHGIEILMRKMNSITIAPDGESATIGGGALAKSIVDTLWEQNKQTGQLSHLPSRNQVN